MQKKESVLLCLILFTGILQSSLVGILPALNKPGNIQIDEDMLFDYPQVVIRSQRIFVERRHEGFFIEENSDSEEWALHSMEI